MAACRVDLRGVDSVAALLVCCVSALLIGPARHGSDFLWPLSGDAAASRPKSPESTRTHAASPPSKARTIYNGRCFFDLSFYAQLF
jgi:hypothetical protein